MANYSAMEKFGIKKKEARYFIPPYEWYNDSISDMDQAVGNSIDKFFAGDQEYCRLHNTGP